MSGSSAAQSQAELHAADAALGHLIGSRSFGWMNVAVGGRGDGQSLD